MYAGYLQQNYDDPGFSDVSGAAYGGQIEWYPSLLTTVRVNARRSIEETILVGNSSYTVTSANIGIDHELLRNVILSADAFYERDNFNGTTRRDTVFGIALTGAYRVNRNIEFDLGYTYTRRDTNVAGLGYPNNIFRLGIIGRI